jgi:hypothetical protein
LINPAGNLAISGKMEFPHALGRLLPDAEQAASGHSSAIPGNNERRQMPNFSGLAY